ncbi:hypothetical protein Cni_G04858 [Canna indica]|uniref:Uncharacterized protein n=1 Tax=Canna indica TaxID=4628 RepID=A0AAQ3JU85_9LILI|nr:hypothetical protein Cni_G04858 [Canna indica]
MEAQEESVRGSGEQQALIHSRVRKIKQEDEKIEDQIEMRPLLRDLNRQLSRSRLGLAHQSILVRSK